MATQDRELQTHKEWLGYLQPVGVVVSPPALIKASAFVNRSIIEEQQRFQALVMEDEDLVLTDFPAFTQDVLGWYPEDLAGFPTHLEVALPEYEDVLDATWVVMDPDDPDQGMILIKEVPTSTPLDDSNSNTKSRGWHASPQARMERLLRENSIPVGLLFNGIELRLIYAPSGETSGHLTFPIGFMTEVPGRQVFGAMHMLLEADRLFHGRIAPEHRLPALLKDSRRYQSEVSNHLAEQVLDALWELLRGFQAADEIVNRKLLADTSQHDPQHIYGGLLTILLRMVFLLYAEDRGMMPEHPVYQAHYSLAGLFDRLREDAGMYPDTMDHRYGAWSWLLSLFRLLYDGAHHEDFQLPPRHGQLFDPDVYPFLEGRPYAIRRVMGDKIAPPQVSDGVVYRVLQKLLVLHGERLSYRALDVEQIGSIYEAMMGFEVERADGPSIALKPSGGASSKMKGHVVVNLQTLLTTPPAKRKKWLKDEANCDITGKPLAALKAAASVDDLIASLSKKISPRTRNLLPNASLFLQPGEERRRTGSHYTPRELTEPIVRTTLRPVLEKLGDNPTPEQILDLKVCDPAMGSGAFLVEACRQLAGQLVTAWDRHDRMPSIPIDEDPILHARRLVAQRCLYGVDKNPFAVNLAKLALWLVTLARDHAFTFLDHALKCGDSLVGLTKHQIARGTWAVSNNKVSLPSLPYARYFAKQVDKARKHRAQIAALGDGHDEEKRRLHKNTEDALDDARLMGDVIIAAFFAASKAKAREAKREAFWEKVEDWQTDEVNLADVKALAAELRAGNKPLSPLHWELEFPEVFDRENPGFDAIVGNPPFLGGRRTTTVLGESYRDCLRVANSESSSNGDLSAFFFRRAFSLIREHGSFGLIATNTIGQGDTRHTGLRWICTHRGTIYNATRRLKWPGLAAVVVSVIHICRGTLPGPFSLDGHKVPAITAFLFHAGGHKNPITLVANAGKSFQGSVVLGMGFTFDDADKKDIASPIAEMHRLIDKEPHNEDCIFPYIGGSEVNTSPIHAHHRYVINFGEMSEEEARQWPDLMQIVEEKVKSQRSTIKRAVYRNKWWQFGEKQLALYRAIQGLERVLVNSQVSSHIEFAFQPSDRVYAHTLYVYPLSQYAAFCALQSRFHEVWARFFGSSMKDDLRYTASDCFETFPFSENWQTDPTLEAAGKAYYEFRAALMVRNNEGMTKTYNYFHDPDERDADILKLRELHTAMDRAVLDAYGWDDISTDCEFLLDYEVEDEEGGRRKKKPWRYRWPSEVHDEVLARLLELNQRRAEAERLAGPKMKKSKRKKGRVKRKKGASGPLRSPLFGLEDG